MSELLKLLGDGAFHSGEKLGQAMGISRSAVWKRLQQLESKYGLVIQKIPGKGYRLNESLQLLDPAIIDDGGLELKDIFLSEILDSTNSEALRLIALGKSMPFLVLSEQQTAGRGRRGRAWASPFATNIYYSLAIQLVQGARQLEGLSLVIGLAVLNAVREAGVRNAALKWPNDLLVGNKKLAGILLELVGDPADICHVVIGVGINVNMLDEPNAIDRPWTSLKIETGVPQNRNLLISRLNRYIAQYLERQRAVGFASLAEEWRQADLWIGREVSLSSGAGEIIGISKGIDDKGGLRLLVEGVEQVYSGGELSLRLRHDS